MRILLNASTLQKGGALQVAVGYILQAVADPQDVEWSFAISEPCAREILRFGPLPPQCEVLPASPAKNRTMRRKMLAIEASCKPDIVYTVFGPAYVNFRARSVMGCAEPWVTNPSLLAYRTLAFPLEWLQVFLMSRYKAKWLRRADAWTTETEVARRGMHKRLGLPLEKIAVVPNSCNEHYMQTRSNAPFPRASEKVRLLAFAAAYRHKNLTILPEIAGNLKSLVPTLDFEIVITLPTDDPLVSKISDRSKRLGIAGHIVNHGPVAVADGPALYQSCHICLLPTLLEVFTATYPEAMAMGLPIVTTDLDFARNICRDAAVYYHPQDARHAAETIAQLLTSEPMWLDLVTNGRAILDKLPTIQQRYRSIVSFLKAIV